VYLFLLSGVRREALNQVCFDETETSEETSVRIAQLSDFYGFNNQPALESSKRRAFISASASPFMRERRSNGDYDALIIDSVADDLVSRVCLATN